MRHLAALAILALLLSSSGCSQPAFDSEQAATAPPGYVSAADHAALQERFDALLEIQSAPEERAEKLASEVESLSAERDRLQQQLDAAASQQIKQANMPQQSKLLSATSDNQPGGLPFDKVFSELPPRKDSLGTAIVSPRYLTIRYSTDRSGIDGFVSFYPPTDISSFSLFFDSYDKSDLFAVARSVASVLGVHYTEIEEWVRRSRKNSDASKLEGGGYCASYSVSKPSDLSPANHMDKPDQITVVPIALGESRF